MTAAVLTPTANPTVEAELRRVLAADLPWVTGRLVSREGDSLKRLVAYAEQLNEALGQFDTLPPGTIGFACTGSSYLIGRHREEELGRAAGLPVIWAAGAIRSRLAALGAIRIAVVSPYPPVLQDAGLAYWHTARLDVIHAARVGIGSADTRAIYAPEGSAARNAIAEGQAAGPEPASQRPGDAGHRDQRHRSRDRTLAGARRPDPGGTHCRTWRT